jgi:hypothetical protein
MALKINDNGIDREMTANEETEFLTFTKLVIKQNDLNNTALAAKQAARQAVLDKLGLTADEANALLG